MSVATVLTVCRGRVKGVPHEGGTLRTAIFKSPVEGPVRVTRLGLDGDAQADARHHGGPEMALLAYSATHYPHWRAFLGRDLERGQFGENLTVSRLEEREVRIGDLFRCGTAIVGVSKPRSPCFKVGVRVGNPALVDAYLDSGRWGIYLRVVEEGVVAAGDVFVPVGSDPEAPTVAEVIAEKIRRKRGG
jgi:MOSC domain-containing protein YiiM